VDHASIVEAMRDPSFYAHPVESVEYLQTHISSVFLTGEYAYKLKKPLDFGFLDFTTAELRQKYCRAELELNRRLAPSVYLRVASITDEGGRLAIDGGGDTVDWVVVMEQLDGDRLGLEVHSRGELTATMIDRVVDILVPFYQRAATGSGIDEYGRIETVKFNTDENFEQTAEFVGVALSKAQYEAIMAYTNSFYDQRADLFQRRIDQGWIRDSHGDLHLGNIFFLDQPVIFDCIEFNDRFRCGDVAVDLAFLAMDLRFQGHDDLAHRMADRYVELSSDIELPDIMPFYCCYRAYVRGKIACLTSTDPALDQAAREQQIERARAYFRLAQAYASGEQ
jgi:aminoglycoside phosphotransferase family enzyme